MNYIDQFKYVMCTFVSGLLTFFFPIKDFITAMVVVFSVNFVFGVIAGQLHGEDWSWRKAMIFFRHCGLFFFVTASVFATGYFMHASDETHGVVKFLCCVAIWFYTTNIVRNWQLMMIEGTIMWRFAGFLYYLLTLKAVEKIPFLQDYLRAYNLNERKQDSEFE